MLDELLAWSRLLRDSFDKTLLFLLLIGLIILVVHMAHDKLDEDHITWAREITGTVLGGLMGLVTGRAMATAAAALRIGEKQDGETQK